MSLFALCPTNAAPISCAGQRTYPQHVGNLWTTSAAARPLEGGPSRGRRVCVGAVSGQYSGPYGSAIFGSERSADMLDTVIRGGQVITPQGAGAWDIGIEGERITAVAQPGTLPTGNARVIDATDKIVSPGGIEPHAHLAHGIMSHPEQPEMTLGP